MASRTRRDVLVPEDHLFCFGRQPRRGCASTAPTSTKPARHSCQNPVGTAKSAILRRPGWWPSRAEPQYRSTTCTTHWPGTRQCLPAGKRSATRQVQGADEFSRPFRAADRGAATISATARRHPAATTAVASLRTSWRSARRLARPPGTGQRQMPDVRPPSAVAASRWRQQLIRVARHGGQASTCVTEVFPQRSGCSMPPSRCR